MDIRNTCGSKEQNVCYVLILCRGGARISYIVSPVADLGGCLLVWFRSYVSASSKEAATRSKRQEEIQSAKDG